MHLFHKWSKWKDCRIKVTDPRTGRSFVIGGQERTCSKCGKKETRDNL